MLFNFLLVLALIPVAVHSGDGLQSETFAQIHRRGLEMQKSLKSFRARFTETTTSSLLVRPIVAEGRIVGLPPARLVMRYESPEIKTVSIIDNRLVVVWPDRGEEEKLNITDTRKAINKYFSDASEKQLRNHFDIQVLSDPDHPGTYLVDMLPRRKQIKKGLEHLKLWLEQESLFMVRMLMVFPGGDSKLIELTDIELNIPLIEEELQKGRPD